MQGRNRAGKRQTTNTPQSTYTVQRLVYQIRRHHIILILYNTAQTFRDNLKFIYDQRFCFSIEVLQAQIGAEMSNKFSDFYHATTSKILTLPFNSTSTIHIAFLILYQAIVSYVLYVFTNKDTTKLPSIITNEQQHFLSHYQYSLLYIM